MQGVNKPGDCGFVAGLGLTYTLYRPPIDLSRPDLVSINNGSFLELKTMEEFKGAKEAHGDERDWGVEVARLQGFILPPPGFPGLKLKLHAERLNATLTVEGKLVQSISVGHDKSERVTGEGVSFPGDSRSAYLIEVEGRSTGSFNLVWVGLDRENQQVTERQLRVFRSGKDCPARRNCLSCVADNACGWCPIDGGFCLSNKLPCSKPGGTSEKDKFHRVLVASECPVCQQHIYCHTCTSDPQCEWLPDPAHCTRRGRFPDMAVADTKLCPPECHERKTCSHCLGTPGRCAWCQHTQVRLFQG